MLQLELPITLDLIAVEVFAEAKKPRDHAPQFTPFQLSLFDLNLYVNKA
jgi:hypothetical protein